jgi:hypothetical protein
MLPSLKSFPNLSFLFRSQIPVAHHGPRQASVLYPGFPAKIGHAAPAHFKITLDIGPN